MAARRGAPLAGRGGDAGAAPVEPTDLVTPRTADPATVDEANVRAAQARVVVVLGAVVLIVGSAVTVLVDRAVLRVGERTAAHGVRRPHVWIGSVVGAVAGVAATLADDPPGTYGVSSRELTTAVGTVTR